MSSYGADLSNWNHGIVDIAKLAGPDGKPLQFVIAKVSEGATYADTTFSTWAQQAQAAKLAHFGAYHFFHAETLNARAQADNFYQHNPFVPGRSIWVDYEESGFGLSPHTDAEEIALFNFYLKYLYLRNHDYEQKVGIYTNGDGYNRIAQYGSELGYNAWWYAKPDPPGKTSDNVPFMIHQFDISGSVDYDWSALSGDQLTQFFTS